MSARKVCRIPLRFPASLRSAIIKALVVCFVMVGCKHAATPGDERPASSAGSGGETTQLRHPMPTRMPAKPQSTRCST